jgi:hypothetical protein
MHIRCHFATIVLCRVVEKILHHVAFGVVAIFLINRKHDPQIRHIFDLKTAQCDQDLAMKVHGCIDLRNELLRVPRRTGS